MANFVVLINSISLILGKKALKINRGIKLLIETMTFKAFQNSKGLFFPFCTLEVFDGSAINLLTSRGFK